MTQCWSEGELRAYLDGELPSRDMERVEQHLRECAACAAASADVAARAKRLTVWMSALPEPEPLTHAPQLSERSRPAGRGAAALVALAASLAIAVALLPRRTQKAVVAPRPAVAAPAIPAAPPVTVKPAIIRRAPGKHATPLKPKPRIEYYVKLDDEPIDTGLIVRVGLAGGQVPADVIVGPDGRARAIRLVDDSSGELK